jgi:hypothetical protein
MAIVLQLIRAGAGTGAVALLTHTLSITDASHHSLTYVGFAGGTLLLATVAALAWVAIERRKQPAAAASSPSAPHNDAAMSRALGAPADPLVDEVQAELVATIDEAAPLHANFFKTPHYGTFAIWRDTAAAFIETVFGVTERQRFLESYEREQTIRESLDTRLERLADLRDRPETWRLRVDRDGLRAASAERRLRSPGDLIVEAAAGIDRSATPAHTPL